MRISGEKLAKLKARARGAGRAAAKGAKGSAVQALVGVISYYGAKAVSDRSETMREKWYMVPLGLAVAGHFAKRRPRLAEHGAALLGAAGYAGAMNYEFNKAAQANKPPETKGLVDPRRGDAGALQGVDPYELPDTIHTDANAGTSAWGYDGEDGDVTAAMAL